MATTDPTAAWEALDRRQQRRLVLRVLGRAFGMSIVLLVGYSVLPISTDGTATGLVVLFGGIAVLVAVLVYELRRIITDAHPQLRAVEAVATVVPLFIIVFAYVYVWLSNSDPANFTQPIDRLDGLYFVITVLTTTGFGDITAVSETARAVVTLQMLLDLALIGIVAKLIVGASRVGVRRRRAEVEHAPGEQEPDPGA